MLLLMSSGILIFAQNTVPCGNLVLTAPVNQGNNVFTMVAARVNATNTCFQDYDLDISLTGGATITSVVIQPGTDLIGTIAPNGMSVSLDNSPVSGGNSNIPVGALATITFTLTSGNCATPMIEFAQGRDCSGILCDAVMPAFSSPICNGQLFVSGTIDGGFGPIGDLPDIFVRLIIGGDYNQTLIADFGSVSNPTDNYYIFSPLLPIYSNLTATAYVDQGLTGDIVPSLCGVSVLDIILMQRFLLGIQNLSASEKIAADLNNSGTVSTLDILEVQKGILGIADIPSVVYPTAESVDALGAPSGNSSSVYSTDYVYTPLAFSRPKTDFVAIKMGDLNNTCDLTSGMLQSNIGVEEKSSIEDVVITVDLPQSTVSRGEEITVSIMADRFDPQFVLSLGLAMDPSVSIVGIESDQVTMDAEENYVISPDLSSLMLVVNPVTRFKASDKGSLFKLRLRANSEVNLDEFIVTIHDDFESSYTPIVKGEIRTHAVKLAYTKPQSDFDAATFAVAPNPFTTSFMLSWGEEEKGVARIEVINNLGQAIFSMEQEINGRQLTVNDPSLARMAPGSYIVRLKLPSGETVVKTVVKI